MSRFRLVFPFICWLFHVNSASAEESPYLKEILLGRCYDAPPMKASTADVCPSVVGDIMNLLESHLDADITASDFEPYLQGADFSSPPDKALFYLRFFGASSSSLSPPRHFGTAENTPGGAFLRDLVFCGVDQQGNCSIEKSNAYWMFWEAAYAKFASQVQGRVQIVVEPKADLQFLQRSVVSNLQAEVISSVTIYGASSPQHELDNELLLALKKQGIENVVCKNDIMDFYLDSLHVTRSQSTSSSSDNEIDNTETNSTEVGQKQDKDTSETDTSCSVGGVFLFLFALAVLIYDFYYYCLAENRRFPTEKSNRRPLQTVVGDWCESLVQAAQVHWQRACATARDCLFLTDNAEHDEESPSEDSPLVSGSADYVIDEFGCRIPTRQAIAQ